MSVHQIPENHQAIVFKHNNLKFSIARPDIARQSVIKPVAL